MNIDEDGPLNNIGYFRLAKNVSKLSNHRVKIGCVLAKKRPIIACSNLNKSHPYGYRDDYKRGLHAEIRAITNCNAEDIEGSVMYVYREYKNNGRPALSRPCNYCYSMMKKFGVKKVYYSTAEYPFFKVEKIK